MRLWILPLLLSAFCLSAQEPSFPPSMLDQADRIAKEYALELAKAPPPSPLPDPRGCLDSASVWFSVDLDRIATPAEKTVFDALADDALWEYVREMGVEGIHLKGLKQGGSQRTGLGLDPRWGSEDKWRDIANILQRKCLALIGDSIGGSTGLSADFFLALKNWKEYPGLYRLVEIPESDWKFLPPVATGKLFANVPWLKLQELQKKGYVSERGDPYTKQTSWNATARIPGADGIVRRWIFLKENLTDPVIDWLDPAFAGLRVASSDLLDSAYRLGSRIFLLDAHLSGNAQETLSLWTRKLGGFSAQETEGDLASLKSASADLAIDALTRPALLHALIAQDAESLRLTYRLFLEEGIAVGRLVHVLQPFDRFACDWAEFLCSPKRKFTYYDEQMTGEALRIRLLKEDVARLAELGRATPPGLPLCTWTGYCAAALQAKDFKARAAEIGNAHLLLAFFYALQPGAFSFSAADLLGVLPHSSEKLNLMEPNESALYSCLPNQFKSCHSFALRLKQLLSIRKDHGLESGELVEVPTPSHPGVLLLLHRLPESGFLQLLAVNFSQTTVQERLERSVFKQTTAIDLVAGHAENKPLDSPSLSLSLPPLSGKAILFQPKYFQ